MSPLRDIVDGIHMQVSKIEDDMKVSPPVTVCFTFFSLQWMHLAKDLMGF